MANETYQPRAFGPFGALNQQNKATAGTSPSMSPTANTPENKVIQSITKNENLDPSWVRDIAGQMAKEPAPAKNLKYNAKMTTYPLNLQGTPELQHYVVFYINIRGSSKYKNEYKSIQPIDQIKTGENRLNRTGMTKSLQTGAKVVAPVLFGYAGAKLAAQVGGKASAVLGAGAISAAAGYFAGAAAADLFQPDTTYRIDEAIHLAVMDRPSVKYGVDYAAQDMGILGNIMQGGGSMTDFAGKMNSELARSMLINVAQIPSAIGSVFGSDFNAGAAISVATGQTPNPFREQIFKAVDNRTFTFDYKFLPRSPEEAEAVKNIINKFKFHMHPEVSTKGYFYIYPSEFNIEYWYKDKQNTNINKISTCVLENMNVEYGGAAGFHSFEDGMPTEINMRLQFKELEVLTKERIKQGY